MLKAIQTEWKTFPIFYPMRMKQCRCVPGVTTDSVSDLSVVCPFDYTAVAGSGKVGP